MAQFSLENFVAAAREAAVCEGPSKATLALMKRTFAQPGSIAAKIGAYDKDDEILFEDSTVSIQYVRFKPGILVPPHDHQIPAFIGVYQGVEENRMYRVDDTGLTHLTTKNIGPGDVLSIGPNGIHAVQALNNEASEAIHVYLGKLTTVERSLFDWETGASTPFTDENYNQLVKHV